MGIVKYLKLFLLAFINYLYDLYLNYKYKDYKHKRHTENQILINSEVPINENIVICNYTYGSEEYVIPCLRPYSYGSKIGHMSYDTKELEVCMRREYDNAKTKYHGDITQLIVKYAGPKGNFGCDTDYTFTPNMIYFDDKSPIMSSVQDDYLSLTTLMGEELIFTKNQPIIINN